MGFNSFLSYRISYVTTLQAICTKFPKCTSERVCAVLNELFLWHLYRAADTKNSTNTCFTSRLKDIQIYIHAAADQERATQTVFQPHIIISVLQTFQ